MRKPDPYSPCPCGSGKKSKFCCQGKPHVAGAAQPAAGWIAQAMQTAVHWLRQGQMQQVEGICRQVLAAEANHADALHLLGIVASRTGRQGFAVEMLQRAVSANPQSPGFRLNLGNAYLALGRLDEAAGCFERALELDPPFYMARINLGNVFLSKGQPNRAKACFEAVLSQGIEDAGVYMNLGRALESLGLPERAEGHYRRALALSPGNAQIHNNLGITLRSLGRIREAEDAYRAALALNPNNANASNNLGNLLQDQRRHQEAEACFRRAAELNPDNAEFHNNLGNNLQLQGQWVEAEASLRHALRLNPVYAAAVMNLGLLLMVQSRVAEALACYDRAAALAPGWEAPLGAGLNAALYVDGVAPEEVFERHRAFGVVLERAASDKVSRHSNGRDAEGKIKIGYVSADFRDHAVAYFAETVMSRHDHERFEVYTYYSHHIEDDVTERFRGYCEHWRNIEKLSDESVADLIREDGIDVLVDLAGQTAGNRLAAFALKPAPVQVTWLGHPATTGLKAIDYRITDPYAEPEGVTEHLNTETLWRLPEIFCCYTPCAARPERLGSAELEVRPTPALAKGRVTFGCFNNLAKISPPVIALWARLLHAIPDASLLLEANKLDAPLLQEQIHARFAEYGIEADRLILLARKRERHYVLYHEIDIALDPFPCVGGTTSFDALWMGVPVVTMAGNAFVSRMGVSLLSNLGLDELIAGDEDAYVEIGRTLAHDLERLNRMRLGLRQRMESSPLMDAGRFVAHMEDAYRGMWRAWCKREESPAKANS